MIDRRFLETLIAMMYNKFKFTPLQAFLIHLITVVCQYIVYNDLIFVLPFDIKTYVLITLNTTIAVVGSRTYQYINQNAGQQDIGSNQDQP